MSQAAPDIYTECLLPLRHGYPLYRPEPHNGLPHACRIEGVSIGDVGIIRPEGYFDFLFNICRSPIRSDSSNPVNERGFPQGLQLMEAGEVIDDENYCGQKTVIANGSEKQTSVGATGATPQIG
jgi:hypothetical protein